MPKHILGPDRLLRRITGLFTLVFCISVIGNGLYTAHEQSDAILHHLEHNALAETQVIGARMMAESSRDSNSPLALRAHLSNGDENVLAAALIDRSGRVVASLERASRTTWKTAATTDPGVPPATIAPTSRTVTTHTGKNLITGRSRVICWVPVMENGEQLWLRTETDTAEAREVFEHILSDSMLHGLIAILLGIAALFALLRRPLAAMRQCTEFAERLDQVMGETLPTDTGAYETDRLAEALNWASLSLFDKRSALAESEAHTGAILVAAIDAVITFDSFGNIIEFNPAAGRMLGWPAEEAMQRPVLDLLVPKTERDAGQHDLLQWLSQRFDAVIGHHIELEISRRDGQRFPAEMAITATHLKGRALFTAFISDISERKAIQEQMMKARDAAEAANRAKSDFLANMSHEIRTPMNAIMGMTELALDTELSTEQREYLSLVKQSSDSLLTLIDDILDFSKIEAGHLSFESIPFSLNEIVNSTVRALAPKRGKQVALDWRIDESVDDGLVGDPTRLRQVLTNLISNALKFTAQGSVDVSVTLVERTPDAQVLRFAVRDTGIGIPLDKQSLIFEAFSQADTSTTRKFGGTGLGLAICTRLVKGMGGSIAVDSLPGAGSTFHFTARFRSEGRDEIRPDTLEGTAVLVIEPDASSRNRLATELARWKVVPRLCGTLDEGVGAIVAAEGTAQAFRSMLVDSAIASQDNWALVYTLAGEGGTALRVILLHDGDPPAPDRRPDSVRSAISRHAAPAELFEALTGVPLSSVPPLADSTPETPPDTDPRGGLRVLLAEDNPVNQTLAIRLLERLGHRVDIAANGLEAVGMATKCDYDLILMDVQMPGMGGFEATRHIRAQHGARHTPIIAMTAHAMAGDREKCLEAGMDGYVSKPIKVPALLKALDEAMGAPVLHSRPAARERDISHFDKVFMLRNLGDDEALLHEVIRLFLRDCGPTIDALRQAITQGHLEDMATHAHTIKGMVRNFGATQVANIAGQLEDSANAGDASQSELATLFSELARATEALAGELEAELQSASEFA
ncbi:MAG TPA: ATP-binding protein [Methyloversatilis sp.]